jgi:hypothetical protein
MGGRSLRQKLVSSLPVGVFTNPSVPASSSATSPPVPDRRMPGMVPFRGRLVAVVTVILATVGVAGCSGSSSGTGAAPGPAPSSTTTPTCPSPSPVEPAEWSRKVPADLPKPPGAHIDDDQNLAGGVHYVKFSTETSLRDSVLFVVQKLPGAGYTLGRGDAEASEADAPFVHGDIRGIYRMIELGVCRTEWLLAVVDTSRSTSDRPLGPFTPHSPKPGSSPLPFG